MKWNLEQFKNKDVVFIGLGQGRSAAGVKKFLKTHGQIASFKGVNQRPTEDPWGFLSDYDQQKTVFIKNEAVPGPLVPVPYISPMQLFFELLKTTKAKTVGITGTKGKSTTASLIAAMLQASGKKVYLCGNIGVSVFTYLDQAAPDSIFVIELSSYQLADLTISPHISLCVNLYNDHADWHGSQTAYWEAKRNIMRYAGPKDYFVYDPSFPTLVKWAKAAKCRAVAFKPDGPINMKKSKLLGQHNRHNAIASSVTAKLAGATKAGIQDALDNFKPLPHRLQIVTNKNGVTYIDDGIATTPEATLAAMATVNEEISAVGCLMLGGEDRGYNFSELIIEIARLDIANLVLFPDSGRRIRRELPNGYKPNILVTKSMAEAVMFAAQNTVSGEAVLLSNASPSYSIWPKGFEQKGAEYQAEIAKL